MTKRFKRQCRSFLSTVAVLLTVGTMSEAGVQNPGQGGRLEGTWNVRVTIRNCNTGAAIVTFPSMSTVMNGGVLLESTSGVSPSLKTPGHGVWEHRSADIYRIRIQWFNFDAAGAPTGWTTVHSESQLNQKADAYAAAGAVETYAPNGNLIFRGCSSSEATRLTFD